MSFIDLPVELLNEIFSFNLSRLSDKAIHLNSLKTKLVCKLFNIICWSFTSPTREIKIDNKVGIRTLIYTRHVKHLRLCFSESNSPSFPIWVQDCHSKNFHFFLGLIHAAGYRDLTSFLPKLKTLSFFGSSNTINPKDGLELNLLGTFPNTLQLELLHMPVPLSLPHNLYSLTISCTNKFNKAHLKLISQQANNLRRLKFLSSRRSMKMCKHPYLSVENFDMLPSTLEYIELHDLRDNNNNFIDINGLYSDNNYNNNQNANICNSNLSSNLIVNFHSQDLFICDMPGCNAAFCPDCVTNLMTPFKSFSPFYNCHCCQKTVCDRCLHNSYSEEIQHYPELQQCNSCLEWSCSNFNNASTCYCPVELCDACLNYYCVHCRKTLLCDICTSYVCDNCSEVLECSECQTTICNNCNENDNHIFKCSLCLRCICIECSAIYYAARQDGEIACETCFNTYEPTLTNSLITEEDDDVDI